MADRAHIVTLEALFQDRLFCPASVQRDYQWTERECEALLDDLDVAFERTPLGRAIADAGVDPDEGPDPEEAEGALEEEGPPEPPQRQPEPQDRPYMLGAVVVGPPREDGRQPIYDGLQRLTTLTILICLLRDLEPKAQLADRLHRLALTDAEQRRMVLPQQNITLYEEAQRRGASAEKRSGPARGDMGRRVRTAIETLRGLLKRWSADKRAAFATFVMERAQFALIEIADPLVASQSFITSNTRGRPLTQADIFKGQLLDLCAQERGAQAAEDLARHWAGLQKRLGDSFTDYLRDTDFRLRREQQSEDFITALIDLLKERRQANQFVAQLHLGAPLFELLTERAPPPAAIAPVIRRLRLLPWSEWRPVAFEILAKLKGEWDRARPLLERLERASYAMAFLTTPRRTRAQVYGRAISVFARGGGRNWRPFVLHAGREARIETALKSRNGDERVQKAALRWLEAHRWAQGAPEHLLIEASVEHVLPRNPEPGSSWERAFPPGARESWAERLGNLALMDREANGALENAEFGTKKEVYRAQTGRYRLLEEIGAASDWTPGAIEARTAALAGEALRLLRG